jgi:hypothetical protein
MVEPPIKSSLISIEKPEQKTHDLFDSEIKEIFSKPGFLTSIEENLKSKSNAQMKSNQPGKSFNAPLPPKQPGFVPVVAEPAPRSRVSCNCKNSQCIKLYCECFRSKTFCKDCNCEGCLNQTDNPTRASTIAQIRQKNPNAFEPKLKPNKELFRALASESRSDLLTGNLMDAFLEISKGCNCKNSNCKKKYCECFQFGIECSFKCKCENCFNGKCNNGEDKGKVPGMSGAEESELRRVLIGKLLAIKNARFPNQPLLTD